jgi:ribosomal protein L11 methyltransferase
MTPQKLITEVETRGQAMQIASALQDLLEPPPDALTVFEGKTGEGAPAVWRIEAYFPDRREPGDLEAELTELLGVPSPTFHVDEIPDLNWVALSQASLPPVQAHNFTVHGSHDRGRVPQGPHAILIEAGEAFGTAHHATTYGCLMGISCLSERRQPFKRILDLGCGSGILAIAAARSWPKAAIHGVDIDEQSVVVARENAGVNRVGSRIAFVCGPGVSSPAIRRAAPFDFIIANILAGPLITLSPDIRRAAAPGAHLMLSGILNREAARVIAAYRAQDFVLLHHRRYEGWSTLMLVKRG